MCVSVQPMLAYDIETVKKRLRQLTKLFVGRFFYFQGICDILMQLPTYSKDKWKIYLIRLNVDYCRPCLCCTRPSVVGLAQDNLRQRSCYADRSIEVKVAFTVTVIMEPSVSKKWVVKGRAVKGPDIGIRNSGAWFWVQAGSYSGRGADRDAGAESC